MARPNDAGREYIDRLDEIAGTLSQCVAALRARPTNDQLDALLTTLDAFGAYSHSTRIPFSSLAITNRSSSWVTVANAPRSDRPPTKGRGAALVPPNGFAVVNMVGETFTLYGTPGAAISVQVFDRPQPPAAAALTGPAATPLPSPAAAAGQLLVTGPGTLMGSSARETTNAAGATVLLRDGTDATGALLVPYNLASNESGRDWFGPDGIAFAKGLFVDRVAGTSEATAYVVGIA